jgi:hypothetical protein
MFVAAGKEQWGRCGPHGTAVVTHGNKQPGDEDLLNVAAMHTLLRGGAAYAVPSDQMPGGGQLAAIYWLPMIKHNK